MVSKWHRFFRYLWRVNAVLIFVAGLSVLIAVSVFIGDELIRDVRRMDGRTEPEVVSSGQADSRLTLEQFVPIKGTHFASANLVGEERYSGGLSSSGGGNREVRNVLFVDLTSGSGHWLLPNHEKIIDYSADVIRGDEAPSDTPIASLFLVKPRVADPSSADGTLILTDPSGHQRQEIAVKVREVETFLLKEPSEIIILFRSANKRWIATVDARTLSKTAEWELTIPPVM